MSRQTRAQPVAVGKITTVAALLGGSLVGLSAVAVPRWATGRPPRPGRWRWAGRSGSTASSTALQQFSGVGDGGQDEGQDPLELLGAAAACAPSPDPVALAALPARRRACVLLRFG